MATDKELSDFLENVERRAFKQAAYAVRKEESALDIVQDAMIKLAEKYGDKPAAELPMLFQRILQNTILDYFRREKVRNTWVSLFSGMKPSGDEHEDLIYLILMNRNRARVPPNRQPTMSNARKCLI
ncbi:RNA polymerase factor sigma-70 [Janthinobacterium lividum]|nr:RNA polymerase factor sigma-70 [Janthinobacterium lividum]